MVNGFVTWKSEINKIKIKLLEIQRQINRRKTMMSLYRGINAQMANTAFVYLDLQDIFIPLWYKYNGFLVSCDYNHTQYQTRSTLNYFSFPMFFGISIYFRSKLLIHISLLNNIEYATMLNLYLLCLKTRNILKL